MALTLESLTVELGRALAPLEQQLAAGQFTAFFAELGLPSPDAVLGAPGVTSQLGQAAQAAGRLPVALDTLVAAIEADDAGRIVAAVAQAAPLVESVIAAINTLAGAFHTTASTAGAGRAEVESFAADLPLRLIGYLVAVYLETSHPVIGGAGELLGIIESVPQPATAHAPAYVRRALRLDRLGPLLNDAPGALADLYQWGTPAFAWDKLLARLAPFAGSVSQFAFVQPGPPGRPSVLRVALVDIGPTEDPVPGLRAGLRAQISDAVEVTLPVTDALGVDIAAAAAIEGGAAIELLPPADLQIRPPTAQVSGRVRIGVQAAGTATQPLKLLGAPGGSRLQAGTLRAAAGADLAWQLADRKAAGDLVIELVIQDGRLVLSLAGADGFLSSILPLNGLTVDFDALAGWSAVRGLYFEGGTALGIDIPVDIDLGPVRIQLLHLELGVAEDGLTLEASGAISARLGPFTLAIDRMGTRTRLTFPASGGNLGPADMAMEFKPPAGIAVSLDAGTVKGGGYLFIDEAAGQYAGVLELTFGPVSVKAIGILSTRLPDGSDGWALLLVVFGEFPAVQLGLGFTLTGVGGVIGLQHGVSVDALQSGLRTGVLDAVLFPSDPVTNAPTLIRQLNVAFPIVPRALTIGPALKIGWSTPPLVTLRLGLILQFDDALGAGPGSPSLRRIVLVGQLKVQIPPVDALGADGPALIELNVDVVGAYDVNDQALAIDAALRDSHIALKPVTGSLVVRARFGAHPTFIAAVGGFHPRFTDLPPGLPRQERIGMQLQHGIAAIRIDGYFAITSNTVQIGAEASLVAAGGGFHVEAHLGFDALFVFDPVFHFEIDFRVSASIRYHSISVAAVKLTGTLTGPGRWEISGSASISLLFFDVSIDFDVAWGDALAVAAPAVAVGPLIAAALRKAEAWTAQLPAGGNALVSLRTVDADGGVPAHPLGEVTGIQKVAPLGIHLDRVGRSVPSDGDIFTIKAVEINGQGQDVVLRDEHFARGEYLDLTEEQKLSSPSFENFPAGVVLSTAEFQVPPTQISFEPEWETAFLGDVRPSVRGVIDPELLVMQAQVGAVARSALRTADQLVPLTPPAFTVLGYTYTVTTAAKPATQAAGSPTTTFTQAAQYAAVTGGLVTEFAEMLVTP